MTQNTAVDPCGANRALFGVLLLAFLLNTSAIDWGIPNVHSWNPDDIAPAKPIRVVQTYINGWDKYPLLQSWIDFVAFAPLLLYWSANGTFEPPCGLEIERCFSDPYSQLGILLILSRLVSALMAAGAVYWTYRLSLLVFQDRFAAALGALVLTCSHVFVLKAQVGNVDAPYLFWFVWSIYHYLCVVKTNETRHYLAFGILSACALATKEQVVGAYVGIGLIIYALHVRRMLDEMQSLTIHSLMKVHLNIRLVGLVVSLLLSYGVINNVFFNWEGYLRHFTFWVGTNAPGIAPHRSEVGSIWLLKKFLKNLDTGMSSPLFLLCATGAVYCFFRHRKGALLLIIPGVSYYVFTIQSIHFSLTRYGLPVVVLLAIFGGVLAARLCRVRSSRAWVCLPVIGAVFFYGFLKSANVVLVKRNDSRYFTEQWLVRNVPKTTLITVFSGPTYLPRFGLWGYEVDRIPHERISVDHFEKIMPLYLVLTSEYYPRFQGKQKEFVDALFAGNQNYHPVWDYKYESPLMSIVGDRYVKGFVNPRITVFKRMVDS